MEHKLNKINVLYDDEFEMMCIYLNDEFVVEAHYSSFNGYDKVADLLRKVGFSVTEEDYEWEPRAV